MARDQTFLPFLWLLSDARNDAGLEDALRNLPANSGFVFRHYHLEDGDREARFRQLASVAAGLGHQVILSGTPAEAREWGADGIYGATDKLGDPQPGVLRLATAHNGDELQQANAAQADGIFLSPVFTTRSHTDAATLGMMGFHALAMQSAAPVIALGGMDGPRAQQLDWPRWGAIDGLAENATGSDNA